MGMVLTRPDRGRPKVLPSVAGGSRRSTQTVSAVAGPRQRIAVPDHRAGEVANLLRTAQGAGPIALRGAVRHAGERGTTDHDVPGAERAAGPAQKGDEMVACGATAGARTGMSWPAGLVHLAGGDAFQPNARPFRTPDRTVPVPHRDGRAGEGRAGGDDAGQEQKREHCRCSYARLHDRPPRSSVDRAGGRLEEMEARASEAG